MYALDVHNGSVRWRWKQTNVAPYLPDSIGSPAVAAGVVFVGVIGAARKLYAVESASGSLTWAANVTGDIFGPPILFDDTIIVAAFASVFCFDRMTGGKVWHYVTRGHSELEGLALFNDTAAISSSDRQSPPCAAQLRLLCAAKRGDPVKCGQCTGVHAIPLKAAGCTDVMIAKWCTHPAPTPLLLAGGSGGLIALDARSGKLAWTAAEPALSAHSGGYVAHVTVLNGTAYFGCWDGFV